MSPLNRVARDWFIATSLLASTTILIGYGVANYNTAQYEAQYELPTSTHGEYYGPAFGDNYATGLHTSH